ncbi:MAG: nuclear transport factor 2 family protein [Candidatus Hydrogenedentota bacterium]
MRHILNMGILLGITAILVASGCATTGSGVSDEEQIRALLGQWKEGILAKDADKLMATYSEDFAHEGYDYQAEDKAGLREFIESGIDEGRFDDVELNMEYTDIVIEDGTATVYPIEYTIWEGTVTIELILTKEEGGWLITDMAIEGM